MDQIQESKEDTPVDKETIDKAIGVLNKIVDYKTERRSEDDRRSGKDRRESVLMPYVRSFAKKMLENLSSAKMLIFFLPLWASIFFLMYLFNMSDEVQQFIIKHPTAAPELNNFFRIAIDGFISWCTFTVSLGGTVIVVRETFKVSKLNALNSGMPETNDKIVDMKE